MNPKNIINIGDTIKGANSVRGVKSGPAVASTTDNNINAITSSKTAAVMINWPVVVFNTFAFL